MLEVRDLFLRFGGVTALDRISFTVADNQICGLIGPNGAGKTSLFNCVTRVYRPSAGTIAFDGIDMLGLRRHQIVKQGVARTFQNLVLFPTITVMQNTMVGTHSRRTPHLLPSAVNWPSTRVAQRRLESEAGLIPHTGTISVDDRIIAKARPTRCCAAASVSSRRVAAR